MNASLDRVTLNGVEYVPVSEINNSTVFDNGLEYVIIRTYSSGVFAGYISERNGKEGTIINSRRLWYWKGAASLSELATKGVKYPKECKFGVIVPKTILTEIIEIIPISSTAKKSIDSVDFWEAN